MPLGCLAPFFFLFLVAGCVGFYFSFLKPALQVWTARGWMEVPCTIISSSVKSGFNFKRKRRYSVDIRYRYHVGDAEYESDRYQFFNVADGANIGSSGKQAIVNRYPKGLETMCYVDSNDPTVAVLDRGYSYDMWMAMVPLLFAFIGAGGIYLSLRVSRNDSPREPLSN